MGDAEAAGARETGAVTPAPGVADAEDAWLSLASMEVAGNYF